MKNQEQEKTGCWRLQFVVDWTLLTAVAWILFSPLVVLFGDLGGDDLWTPPEGVGRQLLLYGAIALIIGGFQSVGLRGVLERARWWVIATVGGTLLGVVAAYLWGRESWPEIMIWIGVPVALLQGLVLRQFVGSEWLGWLLKPILLLLAAIPGFVLGFLVSVLATDALGYTSLVGSMVGFMLLFMPTGLFFGLLTGLLLVYLLDRGATSGKVGRP